MKKDEFWRMCMDCHPINAITERYRHLIPHLDSLLDKLCVACIFSKIDLHSEYHQIHMQKGDEWKTTFKTMFGFFYTTKVTFLGFVLSSKGVHMDKEKVKTIQNWPTPTNISDVRSSYGWESFYRHFVKDFSIIASPLNEIIKNGIGFKRRDLLEKAFQTVYALAEHFYWPKLKHDVHHIFERCLTFKMAKSKTSSKGLYTPLPIPTTL
ncbi:Retrovirus-related Pol polyprotein from transposon gypsy, partial [Mucuna pruriens]